MTPTIRERLRELAETPLNTAELALYRDGLRDAPSMADAEPAGESLVWITTAQWADRCRHLLATIDTLERRAIAAEERERDLRQERVETAKFHVAHDGTARHPETCNDCREIEARSLISEGTDTDG